MTLPMCCAVEQQAAQEKLDSSEERARELYDCNKRLEDHIHDLESRKRAPLYQKKQVRAQRHRPSAAPDPVTSWQIAVLSH
jgi:hypothetical protein